MKNEKFTKPDYTCGNWRKKQRREYDLSPKRFDEAESDLKFILDFLEKTE